MTRTLLLWTGILFGACGTPTDEPVTDTDDTMQVATIAGSCLYNNPFSGGPECKEYPGSGWTPETASADCDAPLLTAPAGVFTADVGCDFDSVLGTCEIDADTPEATTLVFPGDDPADCQGVAIGCTFGSGTFVPGALCEDGGDPGAGGNIFQPFELTCSEPLAGEPDGASEGEVCTWGAISACTEEGRRYDDYASCDAVITQRPYVPYEVTPNTASDDPRLDDEDFVSELAWVTQQVEACACICCHSEASAPNGTSGWFIEAGPIWTDTVDDAGLAMLAGWVDSTAFGAFDPADNNGFDRSVTGLPTTDNDRMLDFLETELNRRGYVEEDFDTARPFGGPLYDQLVFEPAACANGEGIDADGVISWSGGAARYVYVMSRTAKAPGVPPNLDLPQGTRWRLDVAPTDDAIRDGITYGVVPAGVTQAFPEGNAAPAALVSGQTYYLYVLKDIYQPLTRCLFTYED